MRGKLGRYGLVLGAVLALGMAPAAAANAQVHDPEPIQANEGFTGYVNSSNTGPVNIEVSCSVGSSQGVPVGGQPVEVEPTSVINPLEDYGYTGSAGDSIEVTLTSASGVSSTKVGDFTSYYVVKDIPATIKVPCSGSGIMDFVPQPTSSTAVTAKLDVNFVNIGA
jgi:hypothetical protein